MLKICDFEKRYGERVILKIARLPIENGITWIKGENGSGKSTLFKSLAGLIPFSGTIRFNDGTSLQKEPVLFRSRVTYSEAEPIYPAYLTAHDLIHFVSEARKASLRQPQYYIDAFGIQSFIHSPCGSYSSGMLKKVSFAIAFLGNPSVIILDEPLITLDTASRDVLTSLIGERLAVRETAIVVSSHQQIEGNVITRSYAIKNQTLISE